VVLLTARLVWGYPFLELMGGKWKKLGLVFGPGGGGSQMGGRGIR